MPQDDFQAFLEEERRSKKPALSVSEPQDDFQAFLEEERRGAQPKTAAPAPTPTLQSQPEQIQVPSLGEIRRTAERKTSPRARQAASLIQSVEGGKRRALELFKQAD